MVDTASRMHAAAAPAIGAPPASPAAERPARSARFEAAVEEICRRYGSDVYYVFRRPENWVRRKLGQPYYSVGASVTMGLTGVVARLGLALIATAVAGDWVRVNWLGWVIVLAFYAFVDSVARLAMPPLDEPARPGFKAMVNDAMALLPTLTHESDAVDLAAFARKWMRLSTAVLSGALVTVTTLGCAWLLMPDALTQIAAGTLVLIALLLFDFGAVTATPTAWVVMSREARYDHDLFWASPADSPEVGRALSTQIGSPGPQDCG